MRKIRINEEEYAQKIILYKGATEYDAQNVLDFIRKVFGFSRYDSGIEKGTIVYVYVEKDANDDAFFYRMKREVEEFAKKYKNYPPIKYVAERKLSKKDVIREAENDAQEPDGQPEEYSGEFDPNDPFNQVKLVHDPKVRYGKNWADNGGNFPVERNGQIYYVSRSIAVSLATFCQDKHGRWCILANQRGPGVNKDAGLWNLPAGFLDYGESAEDAAARETWEETGVDVGSAKINLLGTNTSRFGGSQNVNMAFTCVLDGTIDDYPLSAANSEPGEVSDIKWIPILDASGRELGIIEKFQWNKHPKEIYGRAYKALTPYINGNARYSDIAKYLRKEIYGNDNVRYLLDRVISELKKNVTNPKALLYMLDQLK